ncbi:hypothetical protein H4Q32_014236 [Labeo rohita]|uniref:Segment polarity dishevelled-like protein n=1 Tax=Labeo rohita TaxID=84645 RepID=A0ABQ8LT94_LABRO|nr:hypothetical protein H4Q32_014236 [Labeo rohita]
MWHVSLRCILVTICLLNTHPSSLCLPLWSSANAAGSQDDLGNDTEPEVGPSVRRDRDRERVRDRDRERERERPRRKDTHDHGGRLNGHSRPERRPEVAGYESSSTLMSSELDTTSFFDSEEEDSASRFSSSTEQSTSSRLMRRHRRRRRKPKAPRMERSSSFSSITDSTMSLNIITVTLNMEKYNFLGISIVGQSNERGDGGIYIGSIMKGGAVAADGRIEPGDMLLQVNDINFENMSNDDAVRVLREIVHKPGPITLTVAKCEPIRPIDPAAWVSHTAAMTGAYPVYGMSPSMSTITSTSSSITSSIPETERSDVVDWLYHHVEGFTDRREARKYASNLLKAGYIRHTVNKITFSEQCYYIFGDLCGNMASLTLHDHDGSSGASDQDTLAPLPHPGSRSSGSNRSGSKNDANAAAGPQESGGRSGSGSESEKREKAPSERSAAAPSEHSVRSSHTIRSVQSLVCGAPGLPPQPQTPVTAAPGSPPDRDLSSVPPELTASRQSFRMAMGNPSEFFVDVM